MNPDYADGMPAEIIQIREVPVEDVEILRARAASRRMSLSGYLRELIHEEVSRPVMADVLARIGTRTMVEASSDDVRSFIDDDRR